MPVLTSSDSHEMHQLFIATSHKRFVAQCEDILVNRMIAVIPHNIKELLMNRIRDAKSLKEMSVLLHSFGDLDVITVDGKSWPIYEIIHRSDALERITAAIGDNVQVRSYGDGDNIWLCVEYDPPAPPESPIVHNPEDEDDEMPCIAWT